MNEASSSSSSSLSAVATRVSARTLAYESSPQENAWWISGSSGSRRATRTCSRAARGVSAQRQASHSAQEARPDSAHSPRRSTSPTSSSQRQVPAYRCEASVASSDSSSSELSAARSSAAAVAISANSLAVRPDGSGRAADEAGLVAAGVRLAQLVLVQSADPHEQLELVAEVRAHHLRPVGRDRE